MKRFGSINIQKLCFICLKSQILENNSFNIESDQQFPPVYYVFFYSSVEQLLCHAACDTGRKSLNILMNILYFIIVTEKHGPSHAYIQH